MRLVQLHDGASRAVALVEEPHLRVLDGVVSILQLAQEAVGAGISLPALARQRATGERLDYDAIYAGRSSWRLLPAIDHPQEPARCLVSGTGLTHLGSAAQRQRMHAAKESELTDSMKMFRLGVEAGRPERGEIGAAPEWFYKGTGTILRAHGEPLDVPPFGEDGGEEGEIAGVYFIDAAGAPRRIGMAIGNEFSDHRFERTNYLNLAGSKLRTCAIGPELVIDPDFHSVPGRVSISRGGRDLWTKEIATGESEMCHSLRNIEHHHFKHDAHRRPGDVHVHYFGACALSCAEGVQLAAGDLMEVSFAGFGRPLRNPLRVLPGDSAPVTVKSLCLSVALVVGLATLGPGAQALPQNAVPPRPDPPTRDPATPGYVAATELPDGAVPPPDADGNFIIGATHSPAAGMTPVKETPNGSVRSFSIRSADSRIYPGIARDRGTFGTPDPDDPAKLVVSTSHPAPYTRTIAVYVPKQYVPGTAAPFIVGADGPDELLFKALDTLIGQRRLPVMIAISIGNGSGDAQGSERGLEYDTMSGRYAEFVEAEVLPLVEQQAGVKLTKDPDRRAAMGTSSGGAAAFSMAWYRTDLYHRVLSYSGTFINQQWPPNPETPHGAWEYHERLIANSPVKPIRVWMEVGDRDLLNPNVMRDNMHDWVAANENMARVLAARGYHYQFVFARNSGHGDRSVKMQTLPEALEWLWKY